MLAEAALDKQVQAMSVTGTTPRRPELPQGVQHGLGQGGRGARHNRLLHPLGARGPSARQSVGSSTPAAPRATSNAARNRRPAERSTPLRSDRGRNSIYPGIPGISPANPRATGGCARAAPSHLTAPRKSLDFSPSSLVSSVGRAADS